MPEHDNDILDDPDYAGIVDEAVAALTDRPRLIGPPVARAIIAKAVHRARQLARREHKLDELTTEGAAIRLGITPESVRHAVWRGALAPHRHLDARTPLFLVVDVDAYGAGRKRRRRPSQPA